MNPRTHLLSLVRQLQSEVRERLDQGESLVPFYRRPERRAPVAAAHDPRARQLETLAQTVQDCRQCDLSRIRRQTVFGEGDPQAILVFIGEAPGDDEDREGRPFVGADGQLLMRIIAAMGLKREQVYLCNLLKCRTPGLRNPSEEEVRACRPFLEAQLAQLTPKVICTLGAFATQALLQRTESIGKLRGQVLAYQGIPVVPTLHPAAMLYQPQNKKPVWEDMKKIVHLLGLTLPATKKT